MNLFLTNSAPVIEEREIDDKWRPTFPGFKFDKKAQPLYGRDGAFVRGDFSAMSRKLDLNFNDARKTDAEMRALLSDYFGFLLSANRPFYLEDRDNLIRWPVELMSFDPSAQDGLEYRYHRGKLSLELLEPYPEDLNANFANDTLADGQSLEVTNNGLLNAFPVILITAVNTITQFSLEVDATQLNIEIFDNSFIAGEQYTLDSITGEVSLAGQDRSYAIADGGLLQLAPGVNNILYNSPDGDIQLDVQWRARYGA